jgi:hypothetical protein
MFEILTSIRFNNQKQTKMKRLFTIALLVCGTIQGVNAQYGYLRVSGGYSWDAFQKTGQVLTFKPGAGTDPAGSTIVPMFNQNISGDTAQYYIKNVNSGYAKGGALSLHGGYMINPYFGVEMGLTYLWGSTINSSAHYNDALLGKGATSSTSTFSNGLSLMPGVFLRAAKPEAKIAPFARLGLSLPVFGATNHTLSIDAPNSILGVVKSEIDVKTESTVSLGVNGSLGLSYTPIPILSVFAEMNAQYLFVRPKTSTLTKYNLNINGQDNDMLATLSTFSKVTEFEDKLDVNSNTVIFGKERLGSGTPKAGHTYVDETKARQDLRSSANFGAIGFNIGVTINMSKTIFAGLKKK